MPANKKLAAALLGAAVIIAVILALLSPAKSYLLIGSTGGSTAVCKPVQKAFRPVVISKTPPVVVC